jgi:DNA segregation ATPase FtsK/SpoIIIE-like protein
MLAPPFPGFDGNMDELFKKAVEEVVQYDRASASLLQRRLDIGYTRAARLMEQLAAAGVVGPAEGSRPREVLIHSAEELLGENAKYVTPKQDDPFEASKNYKVPTDVKMSREDNTPWGKQFSEAIETKDFKESKPEFPILLGFDDEGKLHTESLLDVGNLIVAGNTLSQKENLLDTILLTYLLRYTPQQLRWVLNDETHYLDLYNGVPHLLSPVINDHDKIISAFRWSLIEMQRRMKQFAEVGVRDITSFNKLSGGDALPYILIVSNIAFFSEELTDAATILTEQGIRAGIHNIVVVGRANGESLPRNIKSNIPARVVFRMSSAGESRAIEVSGAEKLEPGQIIYKPNYGNLEKLTALFTPEANVKQVVDAVKQQ